MKHAFAIGILMMVAMATGCNSSKKSVASSADPLSPAPAPAAYQPAPQPYSPTAMSAQPVTYDSTPAPAAANSSSASISGGSYTIKKGDTLYSIARSRYGNGNQYTKIVSANPGLDPAHLSVGKTITLP